MTLKLSEVFIPLSGINIYLKEELYTLDLQPGFIEKMTQHFQLTFVDNKGTDGNLCFAENSEVRFEYRTTFSKTDLLNGVICQLSGETINIVKNEIVFEHDFFCP